MIKEGYKETEIGVIPVEWEINSIGFASKKINVGFVGTCEKFYTDKNNGVLMIRTGNLKEGKISLMSLKYISYEFHNKNIKSQLQVNDLLIARHGSSGLCSIVPKNFPEANCLNIVMIRIDKEICNPIFIMYLFNSNIVQKQMKKKKAGSTQGVVNTKEISKTIVVLPLLKEQQKIAEILSTTDEKIEAISSQIEKAKTVKKGLLQKLLSKGIGHSEFKESELGRIPESWEVIALKEYIVEMRGGAPLKPTDFTESGHLVLHKGNVVSGGKLIQKDSKYTSIEYVKNHSSSVVNNKFLITTLRDLVPSGPTSCKNNE